MRNYNFSLKNKMYVAGLWPILCVLDRKTDKIYKNTVYGLVV